MRWVMWLLVACGHESPPPEPVHVEIPAATQAVDEPETSCGEREIAAAARTLAEAETLGVAAEMLAGCRAQDAICDPPQDDVDACRIVVTAGPERWQVRVTPGAINGAPESYEVWVSTDASEVGRTRVGGSTWAVGTEVRLQGITNGVLHTHGGDAARIGHAEFRAHNTSSAPVRLAVRHVDWLTSSSCEVPYRVHASPTSSGISQGASALPTIELPVGESTFSVGFEAQSAYMSHCDRFAARVTFQASDETLMAIAEWKVTRITPQF